MNIGSEDERVEFKKSTGELKEAIVSISAILNKHREGTLYFGVEDNGDVAGQKVGTGTVRDISHKIYEQIEPTPELSIDVLSDGGKRFIKIAFAGKNAPYAADGRFYLRVGVENRKMLPEQLGNLFYDANDNSKWENQPTKYTIDDIDDALLFSCYASGLRSGRIKGEYDKENLLSKFNLLADGRLTNAGNCLLSKHGPVKLKLALFATDARIEFLDLDHFQGNIVQCIGEAMRFIKKSIRWGAKFSDTVRIEAPEVPIDAVHEIVLNSFAHARYAAAANVTHQIDITPSRISIFNPGRLPSDIVPEDSLRGKKRSYLKNPTIAEFMFRCNMIETYGTGFEKVLTLCIENGTKYEYYNDPWGFSFNFLRDPLFVMDSTSVPIGSELEVYRLLKEDDSLTAEIIAKKIGRDIRTVFRKIDSLKEKGLIKREGNVRNGYWAILPAPFDIDTLIRRDKDPKRRRRRLSENDDMQVDFRETDA